MLPVLYSKKEMKKWSHLLFHCAPSFSHIDNIVCLLNVCMARIHLLADTCAVTVNANQTF